MQKKIALMMMVYYHLSQKFILVAQKPILRKHEYLCIPWNGHEAIVEEMREFLPEMKDIMTTATMYDNDAEMLKQELRLLSNQKCQRPFLPIGGTNAWGSHVNALIFPLTYAIVMNRSFLSPPLGAYANSTSCIDWRCIFRSTAPVCERITRVRREERRLNVGLSSSPTPKKCPNIKKQLFSCDYKSLEQNGALRASLVPDWYKEQKLRINTNNPCAHEECEIPALKASALKKGQFSYGIHGNIAIPKKWRHRGHFWFVAQLLAWLLRPNTKTKRHIQSIRKIIGLDRAPRPILGIHIRRGDACQGSQPNAKMRRCDPFEIYWKRALQLRTQYNLKSVFIASDDPQIFHNASIATIRDNFPVFFVPPIKTHISFVDADRNWDLILSEARQSYRANQHLNFDPAALAINIFTDISLLARCDAFLGKFTSNVDRIAYALLTAHSHCLKPFVSLDSIWCHDWSNRVGKSIHGSFLC